MKLEQGDYLETNFAEQIRQFLPNYETIWGKYIGHGGNGQMIKVQKLTPDEQLQREKFAEHFYTCMESIICMNTLAVECDTVDITNPKEYIQLLNSFMSFQAHSGRIRDNAFKMLGIHYGQERVNEIMVQLEDVYQQRNQVLHGKKLPVRIEESLALIASPMGKEDNPERWNSDMNWSDFNSSSFEFLKDYLTATVEQIGHAYNNVIGNLIDPILEIVKSKNINLESSIDLDQVNDFQRPISGSTY